MTPDLQHEFQKLQEQALIELRQKAQALRGHYALTFAIEPSFEPWSRLSLHLPFSRKQKDGSDPVQITQVIWRSDLDAVKFRDPIERLKHPQQLQPTLELSLWTVPMSLAETILERLSKLSIPVFAGERSSFGCDGTFYEFESDHLFYRLSLRWWEQGPEAWQSLTAYLLEARDLLSQSRDGSPTA